MSEVSGATWRATVFLGLFAAIVLVMATAADQKKVSTPASNPELWAKFPHETGNAVWHIKAGQVAAIVEWSPASAAKLGYRCEVFVPGMPSLKTKLTLKQLDKQLKQYTTTDEG